MSDMFRSGGNAPGSTLPSSDRETRGAAAGRQSVSRAPLSLDEIIRRVADFARAQPVAFFAAAAAGFVLWRFLKRAPERRAGVRRSSTASRAHEREPYGSPADMAGAGAPMTGADLSARPGTGTGGTGTGWTGIGALPGTDAGIRPGAGGSSGAGPEPG